MRRAFIPLVMMLAGVTPGLAQQAPVAEPQTNTPAPARGGVISPVLTIDSERLFHDSAFGQRVTREIDGGLQSVALKLPAVVTTDLRLNEPRYAKLPDIMKAKKKPLDTRTPEALGVVVSSGLELLKVETPAERKGGVKVGSVDELIDKLKNEAKVL